MSKSRAWRVKGKVMYMNERENKNKIKMPFNALNYVCDY